MEEKENQEAESLIKKAKNYFILGNIGDSLDMHSESATNYFKSLSAVDDFILNKINLKPKNHAERFSMLRQYFPEFYKITDSLFNVYRRTYTSELTKEELSRLRERIKIPRSKLRCIFTLQLGTTTPIGASSKVLTQLEQ